MGQLGSCSRLAIELACELGVITEPDMHHLDRDRTCRACRPPGRRWPSAACQPLGDLVATVQMRPTNGSPTVVIVTSAPYTVGEGGRAGLGPELKSARTATAKARRGFVDSSCING